MDTRCTIISCRYHKAHYAAQVSCEHIILNVDAQARLGMNTRAVQRLGQIISHKIKICHITDPVQRIHL